MGIRFACHVCHRRLNIKRELAGRRGICPVCAARIRIPLADCEASAPVDENRSESPSLASSARPPGRVGSVDDQRLASERTSAATAAVAAAGEIEVGDALAEQSEATWYVRPPSGGQYGPATTELLRQWIQEGRVAATALLWREGWPQWREAREALPEFAERLPESGPAAEDVLPTTSDPDLSEVSDSSTRSTTATVATGVARRSRWTRTALTVGLLSVLALSLILVLAFAVMR